MKNIVSVKKRVKKKKKKKKRSRSNDFGSDEYSYSILYSDPRISEYSDTRSSPTIETGKIQVLLVTLGCFSSTFKNKFDFQALLKKALHFQDPSRRANLAQASQM